jgi:hypothetical protein
VRRKREAEENPEPYDSVWCVFDRNAHAQIDRAFARAQENDINIAFSNPCVELWFFLHFEYSTGYVTRRQILGKLKGWVSEYHKAVDVYEPLLGHQHQAMRCAENLREYHQASADRDVVVPPNPWTSVDELVRYLNHLGEKVRRRVR